MSTTTLPPATPRDDFFWLGQINKASIAQLDADFDLLAGKAAVFSAALGLLRGQTREIAVELGLCR